jgi:uncharacterized protein YqeY
MSLETTINEDIKTAMKAGDKLKLEALRAVKSAILLAKTEKGGGEEMSKEAEIALLNKLVKTRKESYDLYVQNNRTDLADVEKAQMEAISVYLPAQMSDEELEKEVKEVIAQVGATSAAEMGKVMGTATKKLAGKADNKRISEMIRKLLP